MSGLSRRHLLKAGATLGAVAYPLRGAATRSVATLMDVATPSTGSGGPFVSVTDFGATGDGVTDDAAGINDAIAHATPGSTIWFPPGIYIVGSSIVLQAGMTYRGSNPEYSIIRQKNGTNLPRMLVDAGYLQNLPAATLGIQIIDLLVDGNSKFNSHTDAIVLMTERALVQHVTVLDAPGSGIVFSDTGVDGKVLRYNAVENRVEGCFISGPINYGIWVKDTNASGRLTDGYLLGNVVKSPFGAYGMRIDRAAGWFIENNHVYRCAAGGILLGRVAGTFFGFNEVDTFGQTTAPGTYMGVQVAFLMSDVRPSVMIGNLCATAEARYPVNSYVYFSLSGAQGGTSRLVFMGNVAHNDPVVPTPAFGNGASSIAFEYDTQSNANLQVQDLGNISDGILIPIDVPTTARVSRATGTASTPGSSGTPGLLSGLAAGTVAGAAVVSGTRPLTRRQIDREVADAFEAGDTASSAAGQVDVVETLSRWQLDGDSGQAELEAAHLTYFFLRRGLQVDEVTSVTGDSPGSVDAELRRLGIYEVLDDDSLKLLAATVNDQVLWTAAGMTTTLAFDPQFGAVPLRLVAGRRYAYAEIQVGGTPAGKIGRAGPSTLLSLEPRAAAIYRDLSDLPEVLAAPTGENNTGLMIYARFSRAEQPESPDTPELGWPPGTPPPGSIGDH